MNNLVKLSEILNSKQKNQTIILSFLLLSMSVFEIFFLHSIYIVIKQNTSSIKLFLKKI